MGVHFERSVMADFTKGNRVKVVRKDTRKQVSLGVLEDQKPGRGYWVKADGRPTAAFWSSDYYELQAGR